MSNDRTYRKESKQLRVSRKNKRGESSLLYTDTRETRVERVVEKDGETKTLFQHLFQVKRKKKHAKQQSTGIISHHSKFFFINTEPATQ